MKRSPSLNKLITLARFARKKLEVLSEVEGGPKNLCGYCTIGSLYLKNIAIKHNIQSTIVKGNFLRYNRILGTYELQSGHSWIELDGYIIDITATQFSNVVSRIERNFNQPVYVCRATSPHYKLLSTNEEAIMEMKTWYEEKLPELCEKLDAMPVSQRVMKMIC